MENKREFKGKTVVITGGGSGIGRATALAFARLEANVFILDRNSKAGKETVALIEQIEGRGYFFEGDVSNETDVIQAMETCVNVYGSIDYAYNNAGIVISKSTVDCTVEEWDSVVNTNLKGIWLCKTPWVKRVTKN